MATGSGVPLLNGNGRTALDHRLMIRAKYHNLGIVMGCKVTTATSAMRYSIGHGTAPTSMAVASRGNADGAVEFPVPVGTVNTTASPTSGARIDVVWARQLNPDNGDSANNVVTGVTQGAASANPVTPDIPEGAVVLAIYQIPQGATSTSQASLISVGDQAIPYGASLGLLHVYTDTANGQIAKAQATKGAGSIVLPTPRRVELAVRPTVATFAGNDSGAILYRLVVDGVEVFSTIQEFTTWYKTGFFSYMMELSAGRHTVSYTRAHVAGPDFGQRYGLVSGRQYPGTVFTVNDLGVA